MTKFKNKNKKEEATYREKGFFSSWFEGRFYNDAESMAVGVDLGCAVRD